MADELQITLDGSYGGFGATDYAEHMAFAVSETGNVLELDSETRDALKCPQWGWQELDNVMSAAYDVSGLIFSWHPDSPGTLMHGTEAAWDAFDNPESETES